MARRRRRACRSAPGVVVVDQGRAVQPQPHLARGAQRELVAAVALGPEPAASSGRRRSPPAGQPPRLWLTSLPSAALAWALRRARASKSALGEIFAEHARLAARLVGAEHRRARRGRHGLVVAALGVQHLAPAGQPVARSPTGSRPAGRCAPARSRRPGCAARRRSGPTTASALQARRRRAAAGRPRSSAAPPPRRPRARRSRDGARVRSSPSGGGAAVEHAGAQDQAAHAPRRIVDLRLRRPRRRCTAATSLSPNQRGGPGISRSVPPLAAAAVACTAPQSETTTPS